MITACQKGVLMENKKGWTPINRVLYCALKIEYCRSFFNVWFGTLVKSISLSFLSLQVVPRGGRHRSPMGPPMAAWAPPQGSNGRRLMHPRCELDCIIVETWYWLDHVFYRWFSSAIWMRWCPWTVLVMKKKTKKTMWIGIINHNTMSKENRCDERKAFSSLVGNNSHIVLTQLFMMCSSCPSILFIPTRCNQWTLLLLSFVLVSTLLDVPFTLILWPIVGPLFWFFVFLLLLPLSLLLLLTTITVVRFNISGTLFNVP